MLLLACSTFSLGVWQLNRAAQKLSFSLARRNLPIAPVTGQWMPEQTLYLDNRQMDGRQGFFVVTPFMTKANEYLLVERGWIQRDFLDRKRLQPIKTPVGITTIKLRAMAEPAPSAVFATDWALEYPIVQYIDESKVKARMGDSQYIGLKQQVTNAGEDLGDGLKRNWYEPATGVEKNYGYAFQWFAMSAVIVGLYVWYQWIKPQAKEVSK